MNRLFRKDSEGITSASTTTTPSQPHSIPHGSDSSGDHNDYALVDRPLPIVDHPVSYSNTASKHPTTRMGTQAEPSLAIGNERENFSFRDDNSVLSVKPDDISATYVENLPSSFGNNNISDVSREDSNKQVPSSPLGHLSLETVDSDIDEEGVANHVDVNTTTVPHEIDINAIQDDDDELNGLAAGLQKLAERNRDAAAVKKEVSTAAALKSGKKEESDPLAETKDPFSDTAAAPKPDESSLSLGTSPSSEQNTRQTWPAYHFGPFMKVKAANSRSIAAVFSFLVLAFVLSHYIFPAQSPTKSAASNETNLLRGPATTAFPSATVADKDYNLKGETAKANAHFNVTWTHGHNEPLQVVESNKKSGRSSGTRKGYSTTVAEEAKETETSPVNSTQHKKFTAMNDDEVPPTQTSVSNDELTTGFLSIISIILLATATRSWTVEISSVPDTQNPFLDTRRDLTNPAELVIFLRDCKQNFSGSGRRGRGLAPSLSFSMDTSLYTRLTKQELVCIARGLGLRTLSCSNKASLVQEIAHRYQNVLLGFTVEQVKDVLAAKHIFAGPKSRKYDLVRLAVEASF
jgi:hypothetical protein